MILWVEVLAHRRGHDGRCRGPSKGPAVTENETTFLKSTQRYPRTPLPATTEAALHKDMVSSVRMIGVPDFLRFPQPDSGLSFCQRPDENKARIRTAPHLSKI